jgi:alpha-1,3/alpha-1,6-mannosyltransferase
LPRHVFYRFHAVCAYLRCIFVALCVLLWWPSFDVILVDQVSVVIPLLKLKASSKIVFYCHFPDLLLAQHTTMLRRLYRKPIDMIEEATTGIVLHI